jgi:diguanylate cyclase (GGDEF)-like protein/PAS domain S-box-containing protein
MKAHSVVRRRYACIRKEKMDTLANKTKAELLDKIDDLRRRLEASEKAELEQRRILEALRASEQKHRILLDESSDPIFAFSPEGEYRYVNQAFADGVGKTLEQIIGNRIWDVFPQDEADKRFAVVKWVFENGESKVIEVRVPRPDGDRYYVTTAKPVLDHDRRVTSVICISKDITARKQAERALRNSKQQYEGLVSNIPFGVYILRSTPEGTFALDYASPRGAALFNSSVEQLLADFNCVALAIHPDDRDDFLKLNREGIEQLRPFDWVGRVQIDGQIRFLHVASTPNPQEGGDVLWHGVVEDITQRKQMEDQIRQLAFHDALTNLPNRRLLNDRLAQAVAASKRSSCHGALILLDLDNFKSLNDKHGHEVGDLLLIEAAGRLRTCVREVDTVARFGGDEFVVIVGELDADKTEPAARAHMIADKIRGALARPYVLTLQDDGKGGATVEHHCTVSIGVMLFGKDDAKQDDLLKWADSAMYQAKEAGRNLIRFYDSKN